MSGQMAGQRQRRGLRALVTDRSGDIPVAGDRSESPGDGIGVWRPSTGTFYLDDGDGIWNDDADVTLAFGASTDIPLIDDRDGNGTSDVGVWRAGTQTLYPDSDENTAWNQETDITAGGFGESGDKPVIGRWAGYRRPPQGWCRTGPPGGPSFG